MIHAACRLISETGYKHLPSNPFASLSVFYILLVWGIGVFGKAITITNVMVFIPSIPLGAMVLIAIVFAISGSKWK
ncbi:MAG: hypothetical protein ABI402_05255 [Ferruginibacter sp.]